MSSTWGMFQADGKPAMLFSLSIPLESGGVISTETKCGATGCTNYDVPVDFNAKITTDPNLNLLSIEAEERPPLGGNTVKGIVNYEPMMASIKITVYYKPVTLKGGTRPRSCLPTS